MKLDYIRVIPSKTFVKRGEPLNVLGGCVNAEGRDIVLRMSVWGRVGGEWKELAGRREEIRRDEHHHIYLTVPSECFYGDFWDGQDPPEAEITIYHEKPSADACGTMVFID